MNRFLIGFGALLLASTALPALAQYTNGNGYGGYGGYRGGNDLNVVRQHVKDCQQHQRLHQELAGAHAQEHAEGLANGADHHDAHDELADVHDQYHDEHGSADNCGYWTNRLTELENRRYYNPREVRQHVRDCRRHEQFHQELTDAHGQEHAEGVAGQGHHDAHDELNDVHDQYHEENGDVQNCDYWYQQNARLQNYTDPYPPRAPNYGR
jgi:hypothetical protein